MVRLRFIASVALTGILSLMTLGTSSDQLLADAASQGQWAAPYEIGAVPIHAILTHNDEILTFEYPEGPANTDLTSRVVTVNWRTHNVTNAAASYDRDSSAQDILSSVTDVCGLWEDTITPPGRSKMGWGLQRRTCGIQSSEPGHLPRP